MKYRCDSIGIHYLANDKSQLKTNYQSQSTNNFAKFAVLRHWNLASAKFECISSCKLPGGPHMIVFIIFRYLLFRVVAYYAMQALRMDNSNTKEDFLLI